MENTETPECRKIQEEIAMNEIISSAVDSHLLKCNSCRSWAEQSRQIVSLSKQIPQYDVPEAVTQRILQAVAAESKSRFFSHDQLFWLCAASITALAAFFFQDTIDNADGLISWSLGFAIIFAVRFAGLHFHPHKVVRQ